MCARESAAAWFGRAMEIPSPSHSDTTPRNTNDLRRLVQATRLAVPLHPLSSVCTSPLAVMTFVGVSGCSNSFQFSCLGDVNGVASYGVRANRKKRG